MPKRVLVTGAGGFIGSHLVNRLKAEGCWVRGVDVKECEFGATEADEFKKLDLRSAVSADFALMVSHGFDEVYHMAADMGGAGYIYTQTAMITRNNARINLNMLDACLSHGQPKLFFPSSACVYPQFKQTYAASVPLKEDDVRPADPDEGYGWEKLFMEKLCEYYAQDLSTDARVARFHNIYGPRGTYKGGREKSVAALCRKVAMAPENGWVEIWGDGEQTRSFLHINDCVAGVRTLMESDWRGPFNIGSDRLISINDLAYMIIGIAGKKLTLKHKTGPTGVRGRCSDNTLVKQCLQWEPKVSLETGVADTYRWIAKEIELKGRP